MLCRCSCIAIILIIQYTCFEYWLEIQSLFHAGYLAHLSGDRRKSSKMAKFSTSRADGRRSSGIISSACLVETITDALVTQRARKYDSARIFDSILACADAALRHKRPQRRSYQPPARAPLSAKQPSGVGDPTPWRYGGRTTSYEGSGRRVPPHACDEPLVHVSSPRRPARPASHFTPTRAYPRCTHTSAL